MMIRELDTQFEWERLAALIAEAFATVAREFRLTPENCPSHPAFMDEPRVQRDRTRGVRFFGGFTDDDRLLGCVGLEPAADDVWYLTRLAVLPEARGQGLGKQLLDHAFSVAADCGCPRISIAIINDDIRLKRWYEAYGFLESAQKSYDHLPFRVCFLSRPVSGIHDRPPCTDIHPGH